MDTILKRHCNTRLKTKDSGARLPEFKFQFCLGHFTYPFCALVSSSLIQGSGKYMPHRAVVRTKWVYIWKLSALITCVFPDRLSRAITECSYYTNVRRCFLPLLFSEVLLPIKPSYSSLCLRIRVPEDPTNTETLLIWYEKQKTFHYFSCISLITDTIEYFFTLLSSEISSFVNWLFMFFSHFFYWVVFLVCLYKLLIYKQY